MDFKLVSGFQPTGDQPEAIRQLVEGLKRGDAAQTLLGVTGSGKTFTIANVLAQVNRPALIQRMRWNILYPITTTINRRLLYLLPTLILKKTYQSILISRSCG